VRAAKLNAVCWTAVFTLCIGGLARAQTQTGTGPSHWTVDSAETVGTGVNVARGQMGFPGLWGDYVHGVDPTTEIGGRLQLNYGVEGLTSSTHFEMAAQFLVRKQFVDTGKIKFAATFNPGILFYTAGITVFGITFPVEGQLGIPIDPKLTFNASFGLPMWVTFGDRSAFYLPIMFGGGVEYLLEPNIALTFKLRMGPTIAFANGTSASSFTLNALFGVAYKIPG
jgi:hypothetical protein